MFKCPTTQINMQNGGGGGFERTLSMGGFCLRGKEKADQEVARGEKLDQR